MTVTRLWASAASPPSSASNASVNDSSTSGSSFAEGREMPDAVVRHHRPDHFTTTLPVCECDLVPDTCTVYSYVPGLSNLIRLADVPT